MCYCVRSGIYCGRKVYKIISCQISLLRWRISLLRCKFHSYASQFFSSARISLLRWRISPLPSSNFSPTLADFSPTLANHLCWDLSCSGAKFLAEKRNVTVDGVSTSTGGLYFSTTVEITGSCERPAKYAPSL